MQYLSVAACGILFPEPRAPALGVQSPAHWTTRPSSLPSLEQITCLISSLRPSGKLPCICSPVFPRLVSRGPVSVGGHRLGRDAGGQRAGSFEAALDSARVGPQTPVIPAGATGLPTAASPLSVEGRGFAPGRGFFSRQEYWSRLSFPSAGDLPDPRVEPMCPVLLMDCLPLGHLGNPKTF